MEYNIERRLISVAEYLAEITNAEDLAKYLKTASNGEAICSGLGNYDED